MMMMMMMIEAANECLPIKPISKYRIPWGSVRVGENSDNMQKTPLLDKKNPNKCQWVKTNKVQRETAHRKKLDRTNTYQKGEYIPCQIDYIRND